MPVPVERLPDHSVRVSRRAKHAHLRFSLRGGLEVVVPPSFDLAEVPALLRAKRRWIERTAREMDAQRRFLDSSPPDRIPEMIELRALGETWAVEIGEASPRVRVSEDGRDRLHLSGRLDNPDAWRHAVRQWVSQRAQEALGSWVARESRGRGMRRCSVSIRWQKTRWGSCTRRKGGRAKRGRGRPAVEPTLSLNAGLLFLPPHLVRYVILHELCHTERMDHSPAFWRRLEELEPEARALREELRSAWRYIPSWAEAAPHLVRER